MNLPQFSEKIARLAITELTGVKEASVFFAIASGCITSSTVVEYLGARATTTRTRLGNLVDKGLISRKPSPKGKSIYYLTPKGKKLSDKIFAP
jgi:DNA-binding MarR family transcriptional regulator